MSKKPKWMADGWIVYWNPDGCGTLRQMALVGMMRADGVPAHIARLLVRSSHQAESTIYSIRAGWDIPKGGRLPLRVSRELRRLERLLDAIGDLALSFVAVSGLEARHSRLRGRRVFTAPTMNITTTSTVHVVAKEDIDV